MANRVKIRTPRRTTGHHGHSKSHCLKILRQLSAYLDDELPYGVCTEIREHLGTCPNCEVFVDSLRQTVDLCKHHEPQPLSSHDQASLRQQILRAAGSA